MQSRLDQIADSSHPTLTPLQHRVIQLLAAGHSISQAAESAQIHRNTIANWRRTVPAFAREIDFSTQEQCRAWREAATSLAPLAIKNLREILTADTASPSLKFRASMAILKMAVEPGSHATIPGADLASFVPPPENPENLPDPAQSCTTQAASDLASFVPPAENPENLPDSAQSCTTHKPQPIRVTPQPGRNSPCPCGSGIKFKRCCANKPAPSAARSGPSAYAAAS